MDVKPPAFQFYPKQWLADEKVMLMDWDAQAMHFKLICIAWQSSPPCCIPNDEAIIKRWLGGPADEVWFRVWPQIKNSWGVTRGGHFIQRGLYRAYLQLLAHKKERSSSGKLGNEKRWGKHSSAMDGSDRSATKERIAKNRSSSASSSAVAVKTKTKRLTTTPISIGLDLDFEKLWNTYPKRLGRKQAERHFKATVKTPEDYAKIEKALANYLANIQALGTEPQFIKHGSTWFNNWQDWIDYTPPTGTTVEIPAESNSALLIKRRREENDGRLHSTSIPDGAPKQRPAKAFGGLRKFGRAATGSLLAGVRDLSMLRAEAEPVDGPRDQGDGGSVPTVRKDGGVEAPADRGDTARESLREEVRLPERG
jgi:hypothetical protein